MESTYTLQSTETALYSSVVEWGQVGHFKNLVYLNYRYFLCVNNDKYTDWKTQCEKDTKINYNDYVINNYLVKQTR